MIQVISRDGVVICVTTVPYPNWVIRDMKQNGYKIRNVEGFAKGTPSIMKECDIYET